jgi:hypothetical protein
MRNKKGIGKEKQLNQYDARFIVRTHMWGGWAGWAGAGILGGGNIDMENR